MDNHNWKLTTVFEVLEKTSHLLSCFAPGEVLFSLRYNLFTSMWRLSRRDHWKGSSAFGQWSKPIFVIFILTTEKSSDRYMWTLCGDNLRVVSICLCPYYFFLTPYHSPHTLRWSKSMREWCTFAWAVSWERKVRGFSWWSLSSTLFVKSTSAPCPSRCRRRR